ncbi:hypothetical protein BGZ83_003403 [Gryganskiella cystojenkinii]|nr:hypothetical protein BGZ83_003403 [Gryganskiella cystojenkinii]
MTRARISATAIILAAVLLSVAVADPTPAPPPPFDCSKIDVDGHEYDISAFKPNTYTVKGEPYTRHPNKFRDDYTLNPCQAITIPEGQEKTHCIAGTWVCRDTKLVPAEGEPYTTVLEPIAGAVAAGDNTPAREVAPAAVRADRLDNVKELPWNLTLKGGDISGTAQSAVITFICDTTVTDDKVGPAFSSYQENVAYFSWKSNSACARKIPLPIQEGMSGFGVFMTILLVFGIIYVVAGAVYNHQVYGAKGLDLLPNLDFWRDFPSLVVDVVRHVWNSVTGRSSSSSRGGYVSV